MYLTKHPNDVIETRTYLPEGTTVIYYNQITAIKYVDINDFDLPYLIDLENDERWCKFDEVKENETDYRVASYITEDEWTPKDAEEVFTRTYLPVGTVIYSTHKGNIGTIIDVEPKDYDIPYLVDFGDEKHYQSYNEVNKLDY